MDRRPATGNWGQLGGLFQPQTGGIGGEAQRAESAGRGQNCGFPMPLDISGVFILPAMVDGAKNSPNVNGTDH